MSRFVDWLVRVSVPATSANLGPGFDSLGLALDLRDRLTARVADELSISVTGQGAEVVPRDGSHLVVQSMARAFEALGVEPVKVALTCDNVIPHARGLGSSSAAIVAGLALARALVVDGDARMDDDALFDLAARLEGHPDNVAPAVYGGLTISGHDQDGTFFSVGAPVDPQIAAVVFVPSAGVKTEVARGLLPPEVPHGQAAANTGAAALLIAALAGSSDQLLRGTRDWLHQDYRRTAMPESFALVQTLRASDWPAVISGAGPTVLVFATSVEEQGALVQRCPHGWQALTLAVDHDGVRVEIE